MAFADYLDLRTAVIEMVGTAKIVDVFDRITKLAEASFNRKLRTHRQVKEYTLTFSNGSATLPTDVAEVIGIYDSNGFEYVAQPPQASRPTGTQSFYSIENGLVKSKFSDGAKTLSYYAKLPTLTAGIETTNWLLEEYPDLYLYGVAAEGAKQIKDVERALQFSGLRDGALAEVIGNDQDERYSRARVRVGGCTP